MDLQARSEKMAADGFYGVPTQDFASGGREQLGYMLRAGLTPQSKVVDLGCGVLRAGYWLIHFLRPGCYHGIEPHEGRLRLGLEHVLEPGLQQEKQPRFDHNENFDSSVFAESFDFFLAYSIWTHAAKWQIEQTLDSFKRDSHAGSVFLTTYLPATWRNRDYTGEEWFGTSHKSDQVGCIHHKLSWIQTQAARRGLSVEEWGRDQTHGQTWLKLTWAESRMP